MKTQFTIPFLILASVAVCGLDVTASARQGNPVYVDDSPQAWVLFRQAEDQERDNLGEAVRIYQELLDEFPLKLLPATDSSPDLFTSVRQRVLANLRANETLLERYQLIQTAKAQRMFDENRLEELVSSRMLTQPGLEALLRLAQRDLEFSRFRTAMSLLSRALQHPNLNQTQEAHAWFLYGTASHYLRATREVEAARQALAGSERNGDQLRAELERLISTTDQPEYEIGKTVLDRGNASHLHDVVAQAIWTVNLAENESQLPPGAEGAEGQPPRSNLNQTSRQQVHPTASPTIVKSNVYINDGHRVVALNRLTGRTMWAFVDSAPLVDDRHAHSRYDLNIVTLGEDSLITFTGHAQTESRAPDGRVICLDPKTGALRWSLRLDDIVERSSKESLFPHGAPAIADGMVFFTARKVSPQLLTSTYVVALDLSSGKVQWIQYITSSGGLRTVPRPFGSVVYKDGWLYVASSVGAAASLEPTTGEVQWLRRFTVSISPLLIDHSRNPWDMTGPLMTERGLIAILPDQRRIVLIEHNTGDLVESYSASSSSNWNMPRYLLANDRFIFAVGSELRAFRISDLDTPMWYLPALDTEESGERRERIQDFELTGRVQVVDNALIVPTKNGVLVVDDETGVVRHTLPVPTTGNPLADNSQLLLASLSRLDSYMSFDRAQAMLRSRISAAPTEPEPALSLFRVGMRVKDVPLCLESADFAIQAITRLGQLEPAGRDAERAREELFLLLQELATQHVISTPEEGESVFATIGAVAVTPEQRVGHFLSYGDWLSKHDLNRAVETYQSILSDQQLAKSWKTEQGRTLKASSWVGKRLSDLIEQHGETIYSPQADYAAFRLEQIRNSPTVHPDDLLSLALEFPLSIAALDAAREAATLKLNQADPVGALKVITDVYLAAPRQSAAQRLFGKLIEVSRQSHWNSQASDALKHLLHRFGDGSLRVGNEEVSASALLREMHYVPELETRLPRIGDLEGDARPMPGSIVPYKGHAEHNRLPDRALITHDLTISMMTSESIEPAWEFEDFGDLPEVLKVDSNRFIIATGLGTDMPQVIAVDIENGSQLWTTGAIAELLDASDPRLAPRPGMREQMPNGKPFKPNETIPLMNDNLLILIQRSGTAAAFATSGHDAGVMQWSRDHILDEIHFAILHDAVLVVIGSAHDQGPNQISTPRLILLNPQSGDVLSSLDIEFTSAATTGITWATLTPLGILVFGSAEGIQAIDVYSADSHWKNSSVGAVHARDGWYLHGNFIIQDHRGHLRLLNPEDGSISDTFGSPIRGEWDPESLRDIFAMNDSIIALYRNRIVQYDPATGAVIGADAITDDRNFHSVLRAHDRLVLISGRSEQVPLPNQVGRRTQYLYSVYMLSENGKVLAEPIDLPPLPERLIASQLIDGWLLVSTEGATLSIPLPDKN